MKTKVAISDGYNLFRRDRPDRRAWWRRVAVYVKQQLSAAERSTDLKPVYELMWIRIAQGNDVTFEEVCITRLHRFTMIMISWIIYKSH